MIIFFLEELVYHNEKQHFKKMQDELKKGRKGPSKIPVLASRSRTPTPRHDSFQLMEVEHKSPNSLKLNIEIFSLTIFIKKHDYFHIHFIENLGK